MDGHIQGMPNNPVGRGGILLKALRNILFAVIFVIGVEGWNQSGHGETPYNYCWIRYADMVLRSTASHLI